MAKEIKFRRGTTVQHSTFTGAEGEITVDTDKDTLVVHDGVTVGGNPMSTASTVTTGLALKANIASPVFTGNVTGLGVATGTSFNSITALASVAPVAPAVTAAVGTSTTVARQDHVHPTNFTATATDIKMDGVQAVGTLTTFPRADHVHPTDTSRAALASPTFTGTPAAPTASTGTNTTQIATTAFVNAEIANDAVLKSGGTMTGAITALRETKVAMGANDIALASGNVFTKTISGATTLTVSGWLASGNANSFILELTNGGSAVVTYPAGSKFAGGTAPTLTASGKDILGCYSHDAGTTLNWIVLGKDVK